MAAVKNNNRIHTRSPFYINAVPSTGTINSADLTVKLQTGTRLATGSMTDLKTYSLSSTNAIDNVIVFNISPLIQDYIEFKTDFFDNTSLSAADENELLYVFWDLSVTRSGGTDDSSGYYVGVEGYSKFDEGVNYQPVTTPVGSYGNPSWGISKATDRTIMATQCYRQISEDSYALLPIYMGEFDESNTNIETFARTLFGDYTNGLTFSGSTNPLHDYTILDSDTRASDYVNNIQYIPIGKKNMDANWESGYDYLTVGHMVNRTELGSPSSQTFLYTSVDVDTSPFIVIEPGTKARLSTTWIASSFPTVSLDVEVGDVIGTTMNPFNDCSETYGLTSITLIVDDVDSNYIDVTVDESSTIREQVDCFSDTLAEVTWDITFPIVATDNDIAVVNDNPLIRYEIICEPKYNVVDFFFINKWGAWDCFTFLKARRENISTKSETYYKSIGGIESNAYNYDKYNNQIQRHNIQMKKTFTVNTGYVNESFSLLLEEILATPRAFMIWDEVRVPVNVTDTRQELKEHVNEKMINYTLELEASNDHINNVV